MMMTEFGNKDVAKWALREAWQIARLKSRAMELLIRIRKTEDECIESWRLLWMTFATKLDLCARDKDTLARKLLPTGFVETAFETQRYTQLAALSYMRVTAPTVSWTNMQFLSQNSLPKDTDITKFKAPLHWVQQEDLNWAQQNYQTR